MSKNTPWCFRFSSFSSLFKWKTPNRVFRMLGLSLLLFLTVVQVEDTQQGFSYVGSECSIRYVLRKYPKVIVQHPSQEMSNISNLGQRMLRRKKCLPVAAINRGKYFSYLWHVFFQLQHVYYTYYRLKKAEKIRATGRRNTCPY